MPNVALESIIEQRNTKYITKKSSTGFRVKVPFGPIEKTLKNLEELGVAKQ